MQIVLGQDLVVENGGEKALRTHENLKQGNLQMDRAIVSARNARKWKWLCCGTCVVTVLVIVIIIVVWA
jgi:syntaxin 1B/2/3